MWVLLFRLLMRLAPPRYGPTHFSGWLAGARALSNGSDQRLIAGCEQMAKDSKREAEAQEWSEGLIADAER